MSHYDLYLMLAEAAFGIGAVTLGGFVYARYRVRDRGLELRERPTPIAEDSGVATTESVAPTSDTTPAPTPTTGAAAAAPTVEVAKPSLARAMSGTRDSIWGKIQRAITGSTGLEGPTLDLMEEILYTSDLGPTTVTKLLETLDGQLAKGGARDLDGVKTSLKSEIEAILNGVPKMGVSPFEGFGTGAKPQVWMIVGVNGVGKTTSIGKIAHLAAVRGARVLVAAGDTFRAAAQAQLKTWTERAQVEIFAPAGVTDPGAVAFDALQMARARGYDLVLIDTAGRLHTQTNLMEELRKVKRVLQKLDAEAPHETLIVLDANSGQNALVQAQKFNEVLPLTGAIFTKMDGTAKGGVVLGLASQLNIPTVFVGIGESMDALTGFNSREYADALFEA